MEYFDPNNVSFSGPPWLVGMFKNPLSKANALDMPKEFDFIEFYLPCKKDPVGAREYLKKELGI